MPGGGVRADAEDLQRLVKAQSPRFQTPAVCSQKAQNLLCSLHCRCRPSLCPQSHAVCVATGPRKVVAKTE